MNKKQKDFMIKYNEGIIDEIWKDLINEEEYYVEFKQLLHMLIIYLSNGSLLKLPINQNSQDLVCSCLTLTEYEYFRRFNY